MAFFPPPSPPQLSSCGNGRTVLKGHETGTTYEETLLNPSMLYLGSRVFGGAFSIGVKSEMPRCLKKPSYPLRKCLSWEGEKFAATEETAAEMSETDTFCALSSFVSQKVMNEDKQAALMGKQMVARATDTDYSREMRPRWRTKHISQLR